LNFGDDALADRECSVAVAKGENGCDGD